MKTITMSNGKVHAMPLEADASDLVRWRPISGEEPFQYRVLWLGWWRGRPASAKAFGVQAIREELGITARGRACPNLRTLAGIHDTEMIIRNNPAIFSVHFVSPDPQNV